MNLISSLSNPKIKEARALRLRKVRQATGLFLVEGIRPVGEAAEAASRGVSIETIFFAPELLTSDYARSLVEQQAAASVPCHPTTARVFASLAEKENPQGIVAVVRAPEYRLADLHPGNFPWGVALVSPQDPGNLGSILRTIDAVGASGLLLLDSSVDPHHPASVRASMGALFWYPLVNAGFAEFAEWVRQNHYRVYGTSAQGQRHYRQVAAYLRPTILLLGSERQGLTAEQAALCDEVLRIPMYGRVTSLNLAIAAGLMLYAMLE